MKLTLPLSLARPLAFAAVSTRLLMGVFLDLPWLYNAGWIAALGATLLCLPLGLLADRVTRACPVGSIAGALEERAGRGVARSVFALLCLICVYETAATSRVLSNTVRHVALAEASAISLLLPLLLVAMLCACFGGQAVGGAARIWLRVMPVLLCIALLLQLRAFRPSWLTPVLGPGVEVLASGSVSASGWLSLSAVIWLCAQRDRKPEKRRHTAVGMIAAIGVFSAVSLALLALLAPPSVRADLTRTYQLDKLLANGRVAQGAQLPLIILWYAGLLFNVTADLFLAAKLLQLSAPRLDGRLSALLAGVASGAAAMLGWAEQTMVVYCARWLFAAVATLLLALFLAPLRKGGKRACARAK